MEFVGVALSCAVPVLSGYEYRMRSFVDVWMVVGGRLEIFLCRCSQVEDVATWRKARDGRQVAPPKTERL